MGESARTGGGAQGRTDPSGAQGGRGNGLCLLDGLLAGQPKTDLLASLSHHVRPHMGARHDASSTLLGADGRFLLRDQLQAYRDVDARLAHYDRRLEDGLAEFRDRIDLLMTIPGIDRASAHAILVELGPDIGVFASHRHSAASAGLCPGNNQSAGKRRHGRTRRGNLAFREVLIECTHAPARTHNCQFRGYHKALTVSRGYKRATVATAHKLLRVIYAVLKANVPYRDTETDYEAQLVKRNAPRWTRMLRVYHINPATEEVIVPVV